MGQPFGFPGVCAFVLTTPAPPHTLQIDGSPAAATQSSSNKEGEADFKETSETCRILPTLFDLPLPFQSLLPTCPNKRSARGSICPFLLDHEQKCSATHEST